MAATNSGESLRRLSSANSIYDAMGLWWAGTLLLEPAADVGSTVTEDPEHKRVAEEIESLRSQRSPDAVAIVESRIVSFADEVTRLAEEQNVKEIRVEYDPDELLAGAFAVFGLDRLHMMRVFPPKTYSKIEHPDLGRGIDLAYAVRGETGPAMTIWPPDLIGAYEPIQQPV